MLSFVNFGNAKTSRRMKISNQIIVTLSLIFSSHFTFGQIDLGTAANFVLFTSSGAIDNIGISTFVGDLGTNVGAITGFPPGIVTGQIHQANPTTLQAAADVEDAYNFLTAVPCDSALGIVLGNGQTLTPNVYCIPAAATLAGDLILDGENDPNSVFVIKIDGLLNITGLSKVILINSAIISNVFWQINGAVNVGDSAIFRGVILANGALGFGEGSILDGNGLTRQGAINTVRMNATLASDSGMPIELIKFEGQNNQTHNQLYWSTASEMNNDYFTIERSIDGIHYFELIEINGAGTCSNSNNYSYADFSFEKKQNYYRLIQTDYDGKSDTLGTIAIDNIQASKEIIKVLNMLGQEIDQDDTGLKVIYFSNGEMKKVHGKYLQ